MCWVAKRNVAHDAKSFHVILLFTASILHPIPWAAWLPLFAMYRIFYFFGPSTILCYLLATKKIPLFLNQKKWQLFLLKTFLAPLLRCLAGLTQREIQISILLLGCRLVSCKRETESKIKGLKEKIRKTILARSGNKASYGNDNLKLQAFMLCLILKYIA